MTSPTCEIELVSAWSSLLAACMTCASERVESSSSSSDVPTFTTDDENEVSMSCWIWVEDLSVTIVAMELAFSFW